MTRYLLPFCLILICSACGTNGGDGEENGGPVDRSIYPDGPYGASQDDVMENHKLIKPVEGEDGTVVGEDFFFGADIRENADNKLLLISSGAGWCVACQEEQPKLEAFYQNYKEKGFVILEVIFQDAQYNPGTAQDAQDWIDEFEVSFPVVAEDQEQFEIYQDPSLAPLLMLIDLDTMEIIKKTSGFQESIYEALVQAELN